MTNTSTHSSKITGLYKTEKGEKASGHLGKTVTFQVMADSKSGAGNTQAGPGTFATLDSKEATKVHQVTSKALRSQPKEAPTGQRWDSMSFKQDNNCN